MRRGAAQRPADARKQLEFHPLVVMGISVSS